MAMLRGSQCESVPFEHDFQAFQVSRSLLETCTRFLACMVDTQDFICQMKNTYIKELWPKVCAEVTESNSKVIGLEEELALCKQETEESGRYYEQQFERLRMASEDERSHWVSKVDTLQHQLTSKGMCELRVGFEGDAEREEPKHAVNFELLSVKLEEQTQLLQQRIETYEKQTSKLSTSNEDLRKQLQIRAEEIEALKKASELARLKQQIQEHQRALQEDSEDRYQRERRLSLKKQRHPQSRRDGPFGSVKVEQVVEDGSLTDLQPVHKPRILQSPANFQSNVVEVKKYDVSVPIMKPAASSPIGYMAPGIKWIDLEADATTAQGKLPEDPIDAGHEREQMVHRPKFEKNAKVNGRTCDSASVPRSPSPKSDECCAVGKRQSSLEPDKTGNGVSAVVADTEHLKAHPVSFSAHNAEVSGVPIERVAPVSAGNASPSGVKDVTGNQTSDPAGVSRMEGELSSSTRSKECSSVDRELRQSHKTSVSETSMTSPGRKSGASSRNTTGKQSKERKWRDTRSRTEGDGEDLHDSFLNTPRELVMANLKSRGESKSLQQQEPSMSPSGKLRHQLGNKVPSPTPPTSLNRRQKQTNLAAPYEWTDECELRDKQPVGSKAAGGKSTWSSEGVEDMEKGARPSSGGSTSSADRGRQAPSSRAPVHKFNEPVRKKRDREQLEATDCLQCRKFYDAVLAEDAEGVAIRCEHHDAVSRHRYKHLPPGTPVGFWNIGFDSEF